MRRHTRPTGPPQALHTERTRIDGAIQNMFDLIEQGVVSARDTDLIPRLAAQRKRRADPEQEIVLSNGSSRRPNSV